MNSQQPPAGSYPITLPNPPFTYLQSSPVPQSKSQTFSSSENSTFDGMSSTRQWSATGCSTDQPSTAIPISGQPHHNPYAYSVDPAMAPTSLPPHSIVPGETRASHRALHLHHSHGRHHGFKRPRLGDDDYDSFPQPGLDLDDILNDQDADEDDHIDVTADQTGSSQTPAKPKRAQNQNNFPHKLYRLVENPNTNDWIHWAGNGFKIPNQAAFTEHVLCGASKNSPWKTTNFPSFIRQLNNYDFHKQGRGNKAANGTETTAIHFEHKEAHLFQRGRPDLLTKIRRKVNPESGAQGKQSMPPVDDAPVDMSRQVSAINVIENNYGNADVAQMRHKILDLETKVEDLEVTLKQVLVELAKLKSRDDASSQTQPTFTDGYTGFPGDGNTNDMVEQAPNPVYFNPDRAAGSGAVGSQDPYNLNSPAEAQFAPTAISSGSAMHWPNNTYNSYSATLISSTSGYPPPHRGAPSGTVSATPALESSYSGQPLGPQQSTYGQTEAVATSSSSQPHIPVLGSSVSPMLGMESTIPMVADSSQEYKAEMSCEPSCGSYNSLLHSTKLSTRPMQHDMNWGLGELPPPESQSGNRRR